MDARHGGAGLGRTERRAAAALSCGGRRSEAAALRHGRAARPEHAALGRPQGSMEAPLPASAPALGEPSWASAARPAPPALPHGAVGRRGASPQLVSARPPLPVPSRRSQARPPAMADPAPPPRRFSEGFPGRRPHGAPHCGCATARRAHRSRDAAHYDKGAPGPRHVT